MGCGVAAPSVDSALAPGLVSTLAVVSTVAGASADRVPVLIAGIATGLAGVFSMAAGEYMSSKSQREIFVAQIAGEREEVSERPGEAEAEMAYMFEEDGLPRGEASAVAGTIAAHPDVLLKTMVEKELGLTGEHAEGSPFQGALVMGTSFGLGSIVPILVYLVLPIGAATWAAVVASRTPSESMVRLIMVCPMVFPFCERGPGE